MRGAVQREDMKDLLWFLGVANERNFTRAAAKLGTSQSTLSHTIKQLEARLGVRLLTRTTRSVALTDAGERLFHSLGPRIAEIDADLADLEQMIGSVDTAIGSMTSAAANVGAVKTRTSLQKDFVNSLMNAIDRGIGTLVDADMTEESTRLQALQTQQQLGVQSLSIANQNSQSVMSLFRS